MAKEKFNWRSLFINEETNTPQIQEIKNTSNSTSFPNEIESDSSSTPTSPSTTGGNTNRIQENVREDVLTTIVDMYESGFESLNMPGYDFYEFFKAIKAVNSNDPSVYKMALTMAQSVDSEVDRESLLKGANYYISEIDKVHRQYAEKGQSKRDQITSNQRSEKDRLSRDIAALEKKVIELQTKISEKKIKLDTTDSNLLESISDTEQKIVGNDIAKSKILNTIMEVVNGIKTNL